MKRQTLSLLMALFIMMIATVSVGGPLDRQSDGRTNPAVDDMLRIPGVIGQSQTEACMLLQQAGLNPVVHMIKGESAKYKGMECQVVKQSPLPGGVAMIGSTVEIDVYTPTDCRDQMKDDAYPEEEEYPDDGTQWSEDEENNWTPDNSMEGQPESGAQPDEWTQQNRQALPQGEKQSLQPAQQKKKIDWNSMQRPSHQKPSTQVPQPKNAKDRAAPLKQTEPIIGK